MGAVLGGLLIAASLLCGCAAENDEGRGAVVEATVEKAEEDALGNASKPTNAKEVYERYKASEVSDNWRMHMTCTIGMTLMGEHTEMVMTEDADIAGEGAHAIAMADIGGEETRVEIYAAEEDGVVVAYVKTPESDTWSKQGRESVPTDFLGALGDEDGLEDAKFEETKDGYVVTRKGADLENMSLQLESLGAMGEDVKNVVEDAFKDASTIIEFDKDCLPRKMSMKVDIPFGETSVASVLSELSYDMQLEMSDYGSVDPDSVVVPKSVVDEASAQSGSSTSASSSSADAKASEAGAEKEEENEKDSTKGREGALEEAKSTLDFDMFYYSRDDFIEMLERSGYSNEDATYAADNCGADWNGQAVGKAKDMPEVLPLTRDQVAHQLESTYDFTPEQAAYGADNCGATQEGHSVICQEEK